MMFAFPVGKRRGTLNVLVDKVVATEKCKKRNGDIDQERRKQWSVIIMVCMFSFIQADTSEQPQLELLDWGWSYHIIH